MRTTDDPKMKINLNAKQSLLAKIAEISFLTGINQTDILSLCLENALPMLEKLASKIELVKETPLE